MLRFDVVLTLLALAVAPALALTIKHYNRLITDVSTEYTHARARSAPMIRGIRFRPSAPSGAFAREGGRGPPLRGRRGTKRRRQRAHDERAGGVLFRRRPDHVRRHGRNDLGGRTIRVLAGRLTIGELLVFISYVGMLYGPMSTISGIATAVEGALTPCSSRDRDSGNRSPVIRDTPNARALHAQRWRRAIRERVVRLRS